VQEGKTPYKDYNFITREVWEEFVEKMSTDKQRIRARSTLSSQRRTCYPTTWA